MGNVNGVITWLEKSKLKIGQRKTQEKSYVHWLVYVFLRITKYLNVSLIMVSKLLEETMKVWEKRKKKKKASSSTSLKIKIWIVFHSLYIESLFFYFSLPQLRNISSTFLSPSHFSTDAFPANFSIFLSVTL